MEEEKTTTVLVRLPLEFDIKIDEHLKRLRAIGIKKTKADLIVKLAIIAFNLESKNI